jgi:hypothetical protein
MQLRDYLHHNKIRKKEFALKVRYSCGYVGRICECLRRPSLKFMEDVERVTNGEVTIREMTEQVYESDRGN